MWFATHASHVWKSSSLRFKTHLKYSSYQVFDLLHIERKQVIKFVICNTYQVIKYSSLTQNIWYTITHETTCENFFSMRDIIFISVMKFRECLHYIWYDILVMQCSLYFVTIVFIFIQRSVYICMLHLLARYCTYVVLSVCCFLTLNLCIALVGLLFV